MSLPRETLCPWAIHAAVVTLLGAVALEMGLMHQTRLISRTKAKAPVAVYQQLSISLGGRGPLQGKRLVPERSGLN